jgi:serine/threonine protein kinase
MNAERQQPRGESCGQCPDLSVLLQLFLNESPTNALTFADSIPEESLEHHIESCKTCQSVLQNAALRERQTLAPLLDIRSRAPNDDAGGSKEGLNHEIPGFRIERELGRGGGAVVLLAEDLTTSRMVALKVIVTDPETNAEMRVQWLEEVRLAARIEHQNVVRLYHVEESSGYFLLVFEYVAGGTLQNWKNVPATPLQIARLIHTIALAVHQIHQQGILHLDLKPSNILIDVSAGESWDAIQPKVSDFGISSWSHPNESDAKDRRTSRGTPSYMAPEQVFGEPALLSPATDVYGLGGLLLTLLTGSPPFGGSSSTQIIREVIESPATVWDEQTRNLPEGLREITLRCLQKHPDHRYSTPKELADDLHAWIRRNEAVVKTSPSPRRFLRTAALSIATISLIVLLLSGGQSWLSILQPAQKQYTSTDKHSESRAADQALSAAEWVDLISCEPAAIDSDRAKRLIAATRHHTNDILNRNPVPFDLCLRYGMLQEHAAERFDASLYREHFAVGAELLAESIRLLEKAVELRPDDESAIAELVAAYFIDSQRRETDDVTSEAIRYTGTARSARILSRTAPYVIRMKDRKQQVLWGARILDHFRLNIWNFRWRGEHKTVIELEQQELDFWNQLGSLRLQPEYEWRHNMARLPLADSEWPYAARDGWLLENDQTPFIQELLFTYIAQTMWKNVASKELRNSKHEPAGDGQSIVNETLQFMRTRSIDHNLLPRVIHEDLVRPLSGIGTDLRRELRLDEAEALQEAYLSVGLACQSHFPNNADVYLAISEAHLQAWKNALRRDNAPDAIAALNRSLEAAKTATRITPDSARARFQVADRIKRLTKFRPYETSSHKN